MERNGGKQNVCHRTPSIRLHFKQNISKPSENKAQHSNNSGFVGSSRHRPPSLQIHSASRTNSFSHQCTRPFRSALCRIPKKGNPILCCSCSTQPSRRLHRRRQRSTLVARSRHIFRSRPRHQKPHKRDDRTVNVCGGNNTHASHEGHATILPSTQVKFRPDNSSIHSATRHSPLHACAYLAYTSIHFLLHLILGSITHRTSPSPNQRQKNAPNQDNNRTNT